MRIDPNVVVSQIAPTTREGKQATRAADSKDSTASVVTLSSAGAAAAAEPTSPSITSRLDAIRALIDRGEYPIDLDKLASRIVDDDAVRGSHR